MISYLDDIVVAVPLTTLLLLVPLMNTSSNLTDELSHLHDGGAENATLEVQWVRWVDIAVGSVGLSIGLYSLFVNIIILAVLVRMSRRYGIIFVQLVLVYLLFGPSVFLSLLKLSESSITIPNLRTH